MLLHYLLAYILSIEKSGISFIVTSLNIKCLLSLTAFKILFHCCSLFLTCLSGFSCVITRHEMNCGHLNLGLLKSDHVTSCFNSSSTS